MKTIELFAKEVIVDKKTFAVTYKTNVEAPPGVLLLDDTTGTHDMMLSSNLHNGGEVVIIMRPTRTPAKKYEVNEKIATLLLFK